MTITTRAIGLLGALLLGACTANGGSDGAPVGGGGSGSGDGSGGDCLVQQGGVCIGGGPPTALPNMTCTQVVPAGSPTAFSYTGPVCELTSPTALEGCWVYDIEQAVDGDYDTYANMAYIVGAVDPDATEGSLTLSVQSGPVPAGQVAAFLASLPDLLTGIVDSGVLRGLTVTTYLGGAQQEQQFFDTALQGDVAGGISTAGGFGKVLVGFNNTLPYDQLDLTVEGVVASASVFDTVHVFEACTAAVPNP